MIIIDKPNRTRITDLRAEKSGVQKAFANEIIRGNIVLLLGHENLLTIPDPELADQHEAYQKLRDCNGSMKQWISSLMESKPNNKDKKQFLISALNNPDIFQLQSSEINLEVRQLINSKLIKVVLTTTYDPLIETLMKEVWGNELLIKNFGDEMDYDIPENVPLLKDDIQPMIYYLFGKATNDVTNYRNPEFVVEDDDHVKILKRWIAKEPKNLMELIRNKRVLAIGCKFEDWLFRFFWKAVIDDKNDCFKHFLAITLTSSPSDDRLRNLFDYYKLEYPDDVNIFLHELNEMIETQRNNILLEERKKGSIFISYCSANQDKALNLFYKLRSNNFNVWMDEKRLRPIQEYDKEIKDAIAKCRVFIPILSYAETLHSPAKNPSDEQDPDFHYYRDVEWDLANTRYQNDRNSHEHIENKIEIIPFALEDYNPRNNSMHQEIRNKYKESIFGHSIQPYNTAGFELFLNDIKSALK